ncbi:hypothetical protein [Sandarakinorhabdus oryzae]|uniref:hypothetical protein n=1 Tax=Sandarakinorhabdus oryzae TaxID=2675220 RepID=UPI0012E27187|nr:hypothetical protein [Sandarakinorhabdus oryzae]
MPNNITAPAGGIAFATDEIAGVHFPYAKLAFGADETAIAVADVAGSRLPVSLAGTVAISAAALPLPAGAASEASLAAVNAKLGALEAGRAPVAVQTLATTTRSYDYASGQRLTTAGAGQVRSTAIVASEVLLHASVRGFFRVGDGTVSASVGPGSIPLAADEKFHLRMSSGQFVSFIRDGASDGSLTIMPVA